MKIYIIHSCESDGACGDPECCGPPNYSSIIWKVTFSKEEAEAAAAPNYYEVEELEIEIPNEKK